MKIHIVGVAGTGMGALAGLLAELGHEVSGSDVAFDPPMGPALREWGVDCRLGFDARHLEPRPDLVVVGNVCRRDNPEARAAIDGGVAYTHIAGALSRFVLEGTRPLVVAGTHGKTTTSSMAAWLLDAAGRAPGFLVGGIPHNFGKSFRAPKKRLALIDGSAQGDKPAFVVEGDEYDTAFFEKTAKFLHYRAQVAIVTSIEHDHIDIYPTEESYLDAFARFVQGIPEDGLIVAHAADATVVDVVSKHARAEVAWYALDGDPLHGVPPHYYAAVGATDPSGTNFDLFVGGVAAGRLALPMTGRHNVQNALAAVAACAQGYGVPVARLGPALAEYRGVKRRQEILGTPRGITVYDDFAHHPSAVRETLRALRARHPEGRLFAVFEPRSATACRALHQIQYPESFDAADEVLLAPLGRDNVPESERLDVGRIAADLRNKGIVAEACLTIESIVSRLAERTRPGDVVALLSNGAFGGIHQRVLTVLGAAS